ncbi:DUF1120 domain-containing protein [Pseudomonas sp. 14P_8.1_Bac3]|uniref:DUF1120 domain-containing protein n=1 Tax=Pseudomonas sp. 14P_8.1_Bac3 TaxID=2971621 RepID=UPI0021C9798A|nr:DUF1120 domain-containing protein [Pseudomonas sp. 14P_8.1_Bac3]MCU1760547.1 DUF1120 domain-containing protein [Pseudomonas sp. 14P_8.1_Bac3]
MNKTFNALFAALLLAGSASAFAASSVDLTVKGTITPSACEPTLSAGGLVDYGKISAKDLNADKPTHLGHQYLQFTLICDAPTPVAIRAQDNRAGSSSESGGYFGLGMINTDEKLGAMTLMLQSPVADGVTVSTIGSLDNGSTWANERSLWTDNIVAAAVPGTLTPIMLQQFNADLRISPQIAPANQLTLTNEAAIDGSVTLSVVYR